MDLLFSQKEGFTDYIPPEGLVWGDNAESWKDWHQRVGMKKVWEQRADHYRNCDGHDSSEFVPAGHADCYSIPAAPGCPKFMVAVSQISNDEGDWEHIYVMTHGDLLALRIQLATLATLENIAILKDLYLLAERSFRKYHEHAPDNVCDECDPQEAKIRAQSRAEARQKRQAVEDAARIAVFNVTDRDFIGVSSYASEEQGQKHLDALRETIRSKGRDPAVLRVALFIHGTHKEFEKILSDLAVHRVGEMKSPFIKDNAEVRAYFNTFAKRRQVEEPFPVTVWNHLDSV